MTETSVAKVTNTKLSHDKCIAFQDRFLEDVSRTFALTIPQLPPPLYLAVGNAYLLCRIADTIEDEPELTPEQKTAFSEWFNEVVKGTREPDEFADKLTGELSSATKQGEKELIVSTSQVVQITHGFTPAQRQAIERCVEIMTKGMGQFQQNAGIAGLKDLSELDHYCYCVAGVVGEMLTDLFCEYSPEIANNREELLDLAIQFGQGLQMTNILKDVWDDRQRGICWLPREVFEKYGIELDTVKPTEPGLSSGIHDLVAIAHRHLQGALRYILTIPSNETGIRQHCLSALGMAVLTLKRVKNNPEFTNGNEVKISRRSVKMILFVTQLLVRSNLGLKLLFTVLMFDFRGLKQPEKT
ncbi:MAG: phytoene/squalene synthase family protein [Rhodobacteraceae bacterium]|nr:phytoene/squalene synthase family protein [Paracoccaceae bacterium]